MNNAATFTTTAGPVPSACPMHGMGESVLSMDFSQMLLFPMHKRVITQYLNDEAGDPVLYLFYGDQEISFDEPELFAFGETLAQQSRFFAGNATSWGTGYAWPRVRELLTQLVEAGILERIDSEETQPAARYEGARPNPLPAATTTTPRTWLECEALTAELTGKPVEQGYLELLIPVFRVAHMALDAEGRQVGEANVFPKALRLDVPTNWRACIYPGSRYQDERPMNVSALKSMRAHWPQMMAALLRIREAYLQRFPAARKGWTIGDVECLSTLVLALPTYMLVKAAGRVENGQLHPVLSCLFRVTDGLRMTTHQMLFVPVAEATLSPQAPVTAAEVYAYAERNHAFASSHGVCAGPKAMIEEFLAVLMDGAGEDQWGDVPLDEAVEAALAEMAPAFDYGLLGLQAHAAVFSLWPLMTRTYARLFDIAQSAAHLQTPAWELLRGHLQGKMQILQNQTLHATEEWRVNREQVYASIYQHCAHGLGQTQAVSLPRSIELAVQGRADALHAQLKGLLATQLGSATAAEAEFVERMADCLARFFRQSQAVLAIGVDVQQSINTLLQRQSPTRPFTLADMDVHVLLQGQEARRLPHLLDALESLLGFSTVITRDDIVIRSPNSEPLQHACMRSPAFADIGLADNRASSTIN